MPVERHFVCLGGLGDGLDADRVDAVAIEEVARDRENSLSRWRADRLLRLGLCVAERRAECSLTGVLPVSTVYHTQGTRVTPLSRIAADAIGSNAARRNASCAATG
jgi:hypothetical protein